MAPPDQVWDRLIRRHRPLPIAVIPVLNETLDCYVARLAAANRLDWSALRAHLAGSPHRYANIPARVLATVSGISERGLRHALLELSTPTGRSDLAVAGRPIPHRARHRPACRYCMLARGHRQPEIQCWALHEDVICRRHQRWLGNGRDYLDHPQFDLTPAPDILRANSRHRALIRRYGRQRVLDAFNAAHELCRGWHRRHVNNGDLERLLALFHGPSWNLSWDDPTINAARYPQVIGLTRILVTQVGVRVAHPTTAELLDAVGVRIAPTLFSNLRSYHQGHRTSVASIGHCPPEAFPAAVSHAKATCCAESLD